MRTLKNQKRVIRLIESAIADLALDLRDMTVLTEAASGPFAVTPVIAALAGAARVIAVGRDSSWGKFEQTANHISQLAATVGCASSIDLCNQPAINYASQANIVTNLGFVRPIDADFVALLPTDSAVALMWEPWEFRPNEVDITACRSRNIPVLGTNEGHSRLLIFNYLSSVVIKLLLEQDIEVQRCRIILISSAPFGPSIEAGLNAAGASVVRLDPCLTSNWTGAVPPLDEIDAIVVAEHNSKQVIIGHGGIPPMLLSNSGTLLIHLCGVLDDIALDIHGITKYPMRKVASGFMTVTTDYAGPRPVIDLHAAGLAVAAQLVREMRKYGDESAARAVVVQNGLGADFSDI
jgi:hypothetical protein